MKIFDRKLIMEDGSEYYGYGFGSCNEKITEVVFNTSPVGYQEIISDPSYTYQTVVMAYPLIGNITMLTSLDTVKVLLDVLEEVTIGVSTIDAE